MKDAFCSHCGTKYENVAAYPRKCGGCGVETWDNPIPVAVAIQPVEYTFGDGTKEIGVLVIRRAIQPQIGKLALPGGFVEAHQTWQEAVLAELEQETHLRLDINPASLTCFHAASSRPKPNRVLMFAVLPVIPSSELPRFMPTNETSERGILFGTEGLMDHLAFDLHADAVFKYQVAYGANLTKARFLPM